MKRQYVGVLDGCYRRTETKPLLWSRPCFSGFIYRVCQRSQNQTGWDCGLKTAKIQQQNLSGGPQANAQCS